MAREAEAELTGQHQPLLRLQDQFLWLHNIYWADLKSVAIVLKTHKGNT